MNNDLVGKITKYLQTLNTSLGDIEKKYTLLNAMIQYYETEGQKVPKKLIKETENLKEKRDNLKKKRNNIASTIYFNDVEGILYKLNYGGELSEKEAEKLKKYINWAVKDIETVELDLEKLGNPHTIDKDREAIFNHYKDIIEENDKYCLEEVKKYVYTDDFRTFFENNYPNINFDEWYKETFKKSLNKNAENFEEEQEIDKEETKSKLKIITEKLNKHKKKIAYIAGASILTVSLLLIAKGCIKDIDKSTSSDNTNDDEYNQTEEINTANEEKITSLIAIGYSERKAREMVENFSDEVIEELLASPFIEEVENYSTVSDFILDYLNDYENARTIYNLTSDNAVDYVNRAYKIRETGLFSEAEIIDIVEIINAIDSKDLFMVENAALAQEFNTAFNRITDNYLFGTITDDDIQKLAALQYFAKDGSDLDRFLTKFQELAEEILKNPQGTNAKDNMYQFLRIYATSLNGFTNDKSALTEDEEFNENAQLDDYYNYYMAYSSFVAPLYPIYTWYEGDTSILESKVMAVNTDYTDYNSKLSYIVENYSTNSDLQNMFSETEIRYLRFQNLQYLILTAFNDPQVLNEINCTVYSSDLSDYSVVTLGGK